MQNNTRGGTELFIIIVCLILFIVFQTISDEKVNDTVAQNRQPISITLSTDLHQYSGKMSTSDAYCLTQNLKREVVIDEKSSFNHKISIIPTASEISLPTINNADRKQLNQYCKNIDGPFHLSKQGN